MKGIWLDFNADILKIEGDRSNPSFFPKFVLKLAISVRFAQGLHHSLPRHPDSHPLAPISFVMPANLVTGFQSVHKPKEENQAQTRRTAQAELSGCRGREWSSEISLADWWDVFGTSCLSLKVNSPRKNAFQRHIPLGPLCHQCRIPCVCFSVVYRAYFLYTCQNNSGELGYDRN